MISLLTIPIRTGKIPKNTEADAFEIWIDAIGNPPEQLRKVSRNKKILLVCKDKKERGSFTGTAKEKVDLLLAASKHRADFVDIGLHTGKTQITRLKSGLKKAELMISFHDFYKTPNEKRLREIVILMKGLGADIVKIACMVNEINDANRLMELALELKKKKTPHVVIGMGELGLVTRIFSKQLGNAFNFVYDETSSAPGQMSFNDWNKISHILS